jgi:hypothetical protein
VPRLWLIQPSGLVHTRRRRVPALNTILPSIRYYHQYDIFDQPSDLTSIDASTTPVIILIFV